MILMSFFLLGPWSYVFPARGKRCAVVQKGHCVRMRISRHKYWPMSTAHKLVSLSLLAAHPFSGWENSDPRVRSALADSRVTAKGFGYVFLVWKTCFRWLSSRAVWCQILVVEFLLFEYVRHTESARVSQLIYRFGIQCWAVTKSWGNAFKSFLCTVPKSLISKKSKTPPEALIVKNNCLGSKISIARKKSSRANILKFWWPDVC
jgi:hypothetical protein